MSQNIFWYLGYRDTPLFPRLPPTLGSNSELFQFQTFLKKVILQNNCKIIGIGTILKNWDPPGFFMFSNWNWDFFEKKVYPTSTREFFPNFSFFYDELCIIIIIRRVARNLINFRFETNILTASTKLRVKSTIFH